MKAGKYSEALDDLLENGKITYFELYKCQNFLKIAKIADEYHQEKQEEESKFFDFDWFMRFLILRAMLVVRKCRDCGQKYCQMRLKM